MASPGDSVIRGPDWKWKDQDGGEGGIGVVTQKKKTEGWVEVKWQQNGQTNSYRMGHDGKFDLIAKGGFKEARKSDIPKTIVSTFTGKRFKVTKRMSQMAILMTT